MTNTRRAVIVALAANVGIALLKLIAFALTGLSSMLSEAIHSLADSGNEILLLVGEHRSKRVASAAHQFGYGRSRYIFAFLVAIILFSAGGLFSIYEAVAKIAHAVGGEAEPAVTGWREWASVVVLVGSMGLEGWSLKTAADESRPLKRGASWWTFIQRAKNPELPVMLLENFAAVVGLSFALLAIIATALTHNVIYDGIGAGMIGLLLASLAVVLMIEMHSLLVGESVSEEDERLMRQAMLAVADIDHVIYLKTQHLGPEEILVNAKIGVNPALTAAVLSDRIDEAEARIREHVPQATQIFLECDIYDG